MKKEMAVHPSVLAWRFPWSREPGGLQSIRLKRARHDWSDLAWMHNGKESEKQYTYVHTYMDIWITLLYTWSTVYHVCVCACTRACLLYNVWLSATPWTVACRALQSVEFFRQGYWNGLPFPTTKDLPSPETEPVFFFCSACIGQGCSLPLVASGILQLKIKILKMIKHGRILSMYGKNHYNIVK